MKKVINQSKTKISKFKRFIGAKKLLLSAYLMSLMTSLTSTSVYASGTTPTTGTAEDKWDAVIGFIVPWITRLGGVVILIGAVEFGLAFKNDDAEGKTKGMRTIIAGCIVFAVGLSSDIFLV